MKRHIFIVLTVMISVLAGTISLYAQWELNGVPICTASRAQDEPEIISDNSGGAIITWSDERGGNYGIYAQRVDANGYVQWTANGVPICTGEEEKLNPVIVYDGAGGAIIAWEDRRGWDDALDIYAQRIDAAGTVLWTADGVAISTASDDQRKPQIISDAAGGAIITWECKNNYDVIRAQKINANGNVQWAANGIDVTSNHIEYGHYDPQITSDGSGGAIITWERWAWSEDTNDIYAQRILGSSTFNWPLGGVAICTAAKDQFTPQIVSDGYGGAIITWQDERNKTVWNDAYDIYAQRVNRYGSILWTADGVPVCTAILDQENQQIISDGAHGAIITWEDNRHSAPLTSPKIYAQRVAANGNMLWTIDGVAVSSTTVNSHQYPQITSNGSGGAIIVWESDYPTDIYAQNLDANGNAIWTQDGVAICNASANQYRPQLLSDGADGAIFTWADARNGYLDIYAQRYPASIEAPTEILVTYPNGGETWYTGNSYNITWNSDAYVGTVTIQISITGGSTWTNISTSTDNDGSYSYSPDQSKVSTQCLIKVTSNEAPGVTDTSDDLFTITEAITNPPPTDLICLNGYHEAIPLTWNAPAGGSPQGYNLYRDSQLIAGNLTRTYYRDEPVSNGQTYHYQVTAVYPGEESDFSNGFYGSAMVNGYFLNAGWASSAPTLDGTINSGEWSSAATAVMTYPGNAGTVRLYVMNNADYLYVAVDDGIDNSLDHNDTFGLVFDNNHNRELPSSGPSSEGLIQIFWNGSASNAYMGASGFFPDNLNYDDWMTPAGVDQGIALSSGHMQYEGRINLDTSPLQSSPGNSVGMAFYNWNGGNSSFTSLWPEALLDLQSYTTGYGWFYGPFSYGDIQLASSSGGNMVRFQVDMTQELSNVNPGDIIGVRGSESPLDWFQTVQMSDPEGDDVYWVDVDFSGVSPGTVIEYKFVHHAPPLDQTADITWEDDPNREITLSGGTQVLPVVLWNGVESTQVNVTFDVTVPAGTPGSDIVYIAGGFNNWDPGPGLGDSSDDLPMTKISSTQWQLTLPFDPSETLEYKYTRGSWEAVEVIDPNNIYANRSLVVPDHDFTQIDDVISWADMTDVDDDILISREYSLDQNYPNPFNPATTINYQVDRLGRVILKVYDLNGREIATLVDAEKPSGNHEVMFDGSDLPSAVYLYKIYLGDRVITRKLMLLK
ncbi:T9SS type A sorting domain-containing protein [candidate division KSB1 bacterium]|nr:T9SS type A sorting domain-containing protein [candidate division KSB1 bacterium]